MMLVGQGGDAGDLPRLLALVLDLELDGHMTDAEPGHLEPDGFQNPWM
jgi:hypothetical protein